MDEFSVTHLSDGALTDGLLESFTQETTSTARVLAFIAEFDARQLYRQAGHPSMYSYCVHDRHLSESAAYKRIYAARAARQFPALFLAVAEGRLHLSGLVTLSSKLTPENVEELTAAATYRTRAEIEHLLAQRFPRQDLPERVRPLLPSPVMTSPTDEEARSAAGSPDELAPGRVETSVSSAEPTEPAAASPVAQVLQASSSQLAPGQVRLTSPEHKVTPLAPRRYGIQFTMDEADHERLRDIQALLGHGSASASLEAIYSRALELLHRELQKSKFAATDQPRRQRRGSSARHIPAEVKRKVRERDAGQCTFVNDRGQRCPERGSLEYDHIDPVGRGGAATVSRIRLRCRAHNQLDAERTYGAEFMRHKRESARRSRAEASVAGRPAPAASA